MWGCIAVGAHCSHSCRAGWDRFILVRPLFYVVRCCRTRQVSLANPYTYDTLFSFATDSPHLLAFKEPALAVPAGEVRYVGLRFLPPTGADAMASTVKVFVFVNNDEDKNEECMEITVVYTDPHAAQSIH